MDRPLFDSSGPNEAKDEPFFEPEIKPERRSQSQPLFDNLMADSGTQMPKQKITEPELLIKEHAALLNLKFLKWLVPTFKPHIDLSSDFRLWLEDAEAIIKRATVHRTLVGVLGYTGSGKSSLINALIEHETIVPTNGMRASTSVAVEICYNPSDDPEEAYVAEIEFVTGEEWQAEFEVLANDIRNRPPSEQLNTSGSTDASIACARLSAIYPGLPISRLLDMDQAELTKQRDISRILGNTEVIHAANQKLFSKFINKYIDSSNKGGSSNGDKQAGAYWPLVRVVRVKVKADLLKTGLVLVDLPGLGDANAGRAHVAENYIKNLHHMWVVADIVRAIDDHVAQDLMGRSFKRQLLMDGKYDDNFVTFIMTKTDQITTDEVITCLGLHKEGLKNECEEERELNTKLQSLMEEQDEQKHLKIDTRKALKKLSTSDNMESSISKRKRKHAVVDESTQLPDITLSEEEQRLNAVISKAVAAEKQLGLDISAVKKKLRRLNIVMKQICIQARNAYTQNHLRIDFKNGLGELEDELSNDEEPRKGPPRAHQGASTANLNTFCVSSKVYQTLQGRLKREGVGAVQGFPTQEYTNMPNLIEFARKCTFKDRETTADNTNTQVELLLVSIREWARNNKPKLSASEKEKLSNALKEQTGILKKSAFKAHRNSMQSIRNAISKNVEKKLSLAATTGSVGAKAFAKKLSSAGIAFGTWKAICRRNGAQYSTGKRVVHQWNEEFLESFLEKLATPWNQVFQHKVPALHSSYSEHIVQSLAAFKTSMEEAVVSICGSCPAVTRILAQMPSLEDSLREKVATAMKKGQHHAGDAHRGLEAKIQECMLSYYDQAKAQSGKGSLLRMQQMLCEHIESNGGAMYKAASDAVVRELAAMARILSREISRAARGTREKILKDFQVLLKEEAKSSDKTVNAEEAAKTAWLQVTVTKEINALEKAMKEEAQTELRSRNPFGELASASEDGEDGQTDDEGLEDEFDSDSSDSSDKESDVDGSDEEDV